MYALSETVNAMELLSRPKALSLRVFSFRIFKSDSQGRPFGPPCAAGDRIGCGINFRGSLNDDPVHPVVPVFFTKNGKEVCFIWFLRENPISKWSSYCEMYQLA